MPLFPFCLFTAIGSGLWVAVLAFVGYWVGNNKELVSQYLHNVTILAIILCLLLGGLYVFRVKQKKSR
jgi:membrane protein DedA with SNARE-associated domain